MANINVGIIIKHLRKEKGLTQTQLSEGICSSRYLNKIENGICMPSLEIVNLFSERLCVNIYRYYFSALRHKSLETHQKIEQLNEFLSPGQIHNLKPLIEELSSEKDFLDGEPFLVLSYAKAVYENAVNSDTAYALQEIEKALTVLPDIKNLEAEELLELTNVELNILLLSASLYRKCGKAEESILFYTLLLKYITAYFNRSTYSIFEDSHHSLMLIGHILLSYIRSFPERLKELLPSVEKGIHILSTYKSMENLPELLYVYSISQKKNGSDEQWQQTYNKASAIGELIYGREKTLDTFSKIDDLFK